MRSIVRWSALGGLSLAITLSPGFATALPHTVTWDETEISALIALGGARAQTRRSARRVQRAPNRPVHRQRAITRGGAIAAGRPAARILRPAPTARGGAMAAARDVRQRAPAFAKNRLFVTDARNHGARHAGQAGVNASVDRARPFHRDWRPSQRQLRNYGAYAGAGYAGEVIADEALSGAYDTPTTSTDGSIAVDNRPSRPGRSYSVSSDEAGGLSSGTYTRGAIPVDPPQPSFNAAPAIPAPGDPLITAPPAAFGDGATLDRRILGASPDPRFTRVPVRPGPQPGARFGDLGLNIPT